MSHTDHGQPDLAALRAAAKGAEFTRAEAGLASTCEHPLASAGPLAPLARDQDKYGTYRDTRQAANTAHGRVPRAFGYRVAPSGYGGARPVTGRRRQGTEAGR